MKTECFICKKNIIDHESKVQLDFMNFHSLCFIKHLNESQSGKDVVQQEFDRDFKLKVFNLLSEVNIILNKQDARLTDIETNLLGLKKHIESTNIKS